MHDNDIHFRNGVEFGAFIIEFSFRIFLTIFISKFNFISQPLIEQLSVTFRSFASAQ